MGVLVRQHERVALTRLAWQPIILGAAFPQFFQMLERFFLTGVRQDLSYQIKKRSAVVRIERDRVRRMWRRPPFRVRPNAASLRLAAPLLSSM